jgi:hypothetical protein
VIRAGLRQRRINLQVGIADHLAGVAITFVFVALSVIAVGELSCPANRRGHRHLQFDAQLGGSLVAVR